MYPKRIILSKTSRIGDVIMAMPVAAYLKKIWPTCHIIMLISSYTAPIVKHFPHIDEYALWDEDTMRNPIGLLENLQAHLIIHLRSDKTLVYSAKKAYISTRIGARNRLFNWYFCNEWPRVDRNRHTTLHEAQLNMQFILPIIQQELPPCDALSDLMNLNRVEIPCDALNLIDKEKVNVIIHPKGMTDAGMREWSLANYAAVIAHLNPARYKIFITGTESDGQQVRAVLCQPFSHVTDLTGKISLEELLCFIQHVDGLIAGSTGPLHMAAASGIHALGLYTHARGHQPSRWKPLGKKAEYLVSPNQACVHCKKKKSCDCINEILPVTVAERIERWQVANSTRTLPDAATTIQQ